MPEIVILGVFLVLGLGAWWSMVTFPKQRDFQKRQKFARSLAKGDEVITFGGLIGRVLDIDAESGIAEVEIADGVVIRMLTAALMQPYDPEQIAQDARRGLQEEEIATVEQIQN
jgi:preprotein translocase subunit YajC